MGRKKKREDSEESTSDSEKENRDLLKILKKRLSKKKKKRKHKRRRRDSTSSSTKFESPERRDSSEQQGAYSPTQSLQSIGDGDTGKKESAKDPGDVADTSHEKSDTSRDQMASAAYRQETPAPSTTPKDSAGVSSVVAGAERDSASLVLGQTEDSTSAAVPISLSVPEKPDHEMELDENILSVLGPSIEPDTLTGPSIHRDVASRWTKILQKGLNTEETKKLMEKYPVPNNCTIIAAPKLNPEVKASIQEGTVTRDNRIVEKQKRIASCLAGIGNAISLTLKVEDPQKLKILEHLGAAGQLLASIQRDEVSIRRSLIQANLNASLKETMTSVTTDEWLFGQNLEERSKTAKTLERASKDLKPPSKPQQAPTPKNSRPPPRRPDYKNHPSTSGGYKNYSLTSSGCKKSQRNKPDQKKNQDKRDHPYRKRR